MIELDSAGNLAVEIARIQPDNYRHQEQESDFHVSSCARLIITAAKYSKKESKQENEDIAEKTGEPERRYQHYSSEHK